MTQGKEEAEESVQGRDQDQWVPEHQVPEMPPVTERSEDGIVRT